MRSVHESNVTDDPAPGLRSMGAPGVAESSVAGVWTLAGDRPIIAEADGPATLLVPTESVLLLAVDLPLATRARRLEALPFAIEDRIAEPIDTVHLALGMELAPRRHLVGVVRHSVMQAWVDRAEETGLGHAAIVPDALALPVPEPGAWAVDLSDARAMVRASDGTGFAVASTMLLPAWEAAGRPPAIAYGAPLPPEMALATGSLETASLAERLRAPALDLRQGAYARRRAARPEIWRRLAWLAVIGVIAHAVIAGADTLMLRAIAERRAEETRALVALAAPGTNLSGDLATTVTGLLPQGGGAVPQPFLPLVSRVSNALAPLAGSLVVRAMTFQADTLTLDLDGAEPGLAARIGAALRGAGVAAQVTESAGTIRITARAP